VERPAERDAEPRPHRRRPRRARRHLEQPGGARHGGNSWNRLGYGGPCPPSGTHRYFFKLYALDAKLGLKAGATKEDLLRAMEKHVLEQTELMGVYARK
jgi:Raf kinase inhibitor-like YbhB/YbcL family protein